MTRALARHHRRLARLLALDKAMGCLAPFITFDDPTARCANDTPAGVGEGQRAGDLPKAGALVGPQTRAAESPRSR